MIEASPKKSKSRAELLVEEAARVGGQVTYLGYLAVAVPDGINWHRIVNENGRVLKTHYRGLSDEDLIRTVIYEDLATDLFQIDSRWLFDRMQKDMNEGHTEDLERAETMYLRATAVLDVLDNFSYEELKDEFNLRRHNDFLNGGSGISFEKTINTVALDCSKDLGKIFENIGYSPILPDVSAEAADC